MLAEAKIIIGAALLVLIIGLISAAYYYRTEYATAKKDLTTCQEANEKNNETIDALKKEVKNTSASADKRLQAKDELVRRLQEIDSLAVEKDEKKNSAIGADPLLDRLNGMFPSGGKDGVR